MEIEVLESTKNRLLVKLVGEDHTLCNILRGELQTMDEVKLASYRIKHPLIGNPELLLETKKEDAKKVLQSAIQQIEKKFDKLKDAVKKI